MSAQPNQFDLSIESMTEHDLDVVMANENAAYPIPWSRAVFQDCLGNKRNECYIATTGSRICGHSIVSHVLDETHLLNICVAPSHAGKGLGRRFLRALIQKAINRNSTSFFLEVRVSNQIAIDLYLSEGFNEVGIRPNYYPANEGREDALLMTLELSIDQYV